jgi:foldase protein PrsA
MKRFALPRYLLITSIFVLGISFLSACTTTNQEAGANDAGLTGGIAATVNGTEIEEDTITTWVNSFRTSNAVDSEEDWGTWLNNYSYTPDTVRTEVLDMFIGEELIRQAAAENDIVIESTTVDEYVNTVKANYTDDAAWEAALVAANTTETEYRKSIESALLERGLKAAVAAETDPTDEDLLTYAQSKVSTYDGAKRSSHILFSANDTALAQEVLDKINAGELDFAQAALEYSQDSSSETGGDVGWDKLATFVDPYTAALDLLELNQVSGLVVSDYGIHIIKCTEVFVAPAEVTSLSQIPTDILTSFSASLATSNSTTAFTNWFAEYKENADIVIYDMPENVPYNLDMTLYETTEEETIDESTTDEATTDEAATDESAGIE